MNQPPNPKLKKKRQVAIARNGKEARLKTPRTAADNVGQKTCCNKVDNRKNKTTKLKRTPLPYLEKKYD